jgi:membrane protease YdiL (CAAX protease family)
MKASSMVSRVVNEWEGRVPWRPRDILLSLLAGFGLGVGALVVFYIAVSLWGPLDWGVTALALTTSLVYAGFLGGVYLVLVRRKGVSFKDIGFVSVPARTIALMFPLALGVLFLVGLVAAATSPLLGDAPSTSRQLALQQGTSLSGGEAAMLFVAAAIVAPFVEEMFFRGLIYRYLRGRYSVVPALITSSALFAVMHPYLPLLPGLFVLGAVFARVTERYQSLYPAVLLHGLNNGFAVLVVALVSS